MKHPVKLLIVIIVAVILAMTFVNNSADAPSDTEIDVPIDSEEVVEEKVVNNKPKAPVVQQPPVAAEPEEESTCGKKNDVCGDSSDCCANLSLECLEVTLSSGAKQKRCMPFTTNVCSIKCEENGTWSSPRSCIAATIPATDTPDCATLVGECDPSAYEERGTRKCWRS